MNEHILLGNFMIVGHIRYASLSHIMISTQIWFDTRGHTGILHLSNGKIRTEMTVEGPNSRLNVTHGT